MVIPRTTTRGKKLFWWDFTLNNYTNEMCDSVTVTLEKLCEHYIVGKEIGDSGTPHLQGMFKLKKTNYKSYLLNSDLNKGCLTNKLSFRPGRNISALRDYCLKDGDLLCSSDLEKINVSLAKPKEKSFAEISDIYLKKNELDFNTFTENLNYETGIFNEHEIYYKHK